MSVQHVKDMATSLDGVMSEVCLEKLLPDAAQVVPTWRSPDSPAAVQTPPPFFRVHRFMVTVSRAVRRDDFGNGATERGEKCDKIVFPFSLWTRGGGRRVKSEGGERVVPGHGTLPLFF